MVKREFAKAEVLIKFAVNFARYIHLLRFLLNYSKCNIDAGIKIS